MARFRVVIAPGVAHIIDAANEDEARKKQWIESEEVQKLMEKLEIEDSKIKPIIKKLSDEGMVNIKNKKLIEISS